MKIILEMAGYRCHTEWLARPLTREEVAKLTPVEMKARRLAQVRACRHRQKFAKAVANLDAPTATGRDILDLSPRIIY
jgi:hypothetical protein